jgi:hypothetical protein
MIRTTLTAPAQQIYTTAWDVTLVRWLRVSGW